MINILKTVTMSPEQYEIVIEGMRNSFNSWDKSDSYSSYVEDPDTGVTVPFEFFIGDNDISRMTDLAIRGSSHSKYCRMMPVWVSLTAPLYWWKEMDTYKVGTVCNSCSTMHTVTAKEFDISDFSVENLVDVDGTWALSSMNAVINSLNRSRTLYLETKKREYWDNIIQLLPSSYNQKRTLMLNYEVLANIYRDRKNHKLAEWHTFCEWIESLPYANELIIRQTATEFECTKEETDDQCK